MAITTVDGLLAGLRRPETWLKHTGVYEGSGVWHSLLLCAGMPGAGSAPTPGMAGAAITSLVGMPPFTHPGGSDKAYLARCTGDSNIAGKLYLCDRLWHSSGIAPATTTAQTVNSVAWPARDINGTTNGDGVLVGIECYVATTNGAVIATSTLQYTNSDGTAGRTGTFASATGAPGTIWPITAVPGTVVPFLLQAGDRGVRSVQSVTLGTSYVAGTIGLVAFRPLCTVELIVANAGIQLDWSQLGLPELYADTTFWLMYKSLTTTAGSIWGQIQLAHG